MRKKMIKIPQSTYQRLLEHLQAHAPTDSWAAQVLSELEQKAKPAYILPSGTYILDSEINVEYRVN
jgi:predicted nucleotide-binding protein (sugar kinase/HSP70/actin superfamily)